MHSHPLHTVCLGGRRRNHRRRRYSPKKHTSLWHWSPSLHRRVRYFWGCSQDSKTWWLWGHAAPSSHVSPFRTAGHISQSYWWVRGSRRLAFSPGWAKGQEGQSCTNLCVMHAAGQHRTAQQQQVMDPASTRNAKISNANTAGIPIAEAWGRACVDGESPERSLGPSDEDLLSHL